MDMKINANSNPGLKPQSSMSHCQTSVDDFMLNSSFSDYTMAPCDLEMCRVCFASDCKLYPMTVKLNKAYKMLTGLSVKNEDSLPPHLCTECARRLMNYIRFRTRTLRAHLVMLEVIGKNKHITLESIKSIAGDRIGTNLRITHNRTDHYDVHINHDQEEMENVNADIKAENDMIVHDDECHETSKDAMVYLPECDIKDEKDEMDCEDFINYENIVDDSTEVHIDEVKIEINSSNTLESNANSPSLDKNTTGDFIDGNILGKYDRNTEKMPVERQHMTEKNDRVNNYKVKDGVRTNNSEIYRM